MVRLALAVAAAVVAAIVVAACRRGARAGAGRARLGATSRACRCGASRRTSHAARRWPASPARRARSRLRTVAGGLRQPVQVVARTGRRAHLYVAEQTGRIRVIERGRVRPRPYLDLRRRVSAGGELGLLSVTFDPRGRWLYVLYTNRHQDTRVVRYRAGERAADRASARVLLAVDQPYENHKGGTLLFDERGRLVLGLGDGGSAFDPEQRAQRERSRLGKLLRWDPQRPDLGWQIVATGLRNPWRMSFDRATGMLWLGDVGQDRVEEIDALYLPEYGQRLPNLGWAAYEGDLPLGRKHLSNGAMLVWPLAGYRHTGGRCSVAGGHVYRAARNPAMNGRYVFGDFCRGTIWSLDARGAERRRMLDVRRGGRARARPRVLRRGPRRRAVRRLGAGHGVAARRRGGALTGQMVDSTTTRPRNQPSTAAPRGRAGRARAAPRSAPGARARSRARARRGRSAARAAPRSRSASPSSPPRRRSPGCRRRAGAAARSPGSSLTTSTKTSSAAVAMPGREQRRVDLGEQPRAVGAEAARGVVERRVDALEARLDGEQGERVEAHDVGEQQPEHGAGEQQPRVDPERVAAGHGDVAVHPRERDVDGDGDDGAGHGIAERGHPRQQRRRHATGSIRRP